MAFTMVYFHKGIYSSHNTVDIWTVITIGFRSVITIVLVAADRTKQSGGFVKAAKCTNDLLAFQRT